MDIIQQQKKQIQSVSVNFFSLKGKTFDFVDWLFENYELIDKASERQRPSRTPMRKEFKVIMCVQETTLHNDLQSYFSKGWEPTFPLVVINDGEINTYLQYLSRKISD